PPATVKPGPGHTTKPQTSSHGSSGNNNGKSNTSHSTLCNLSDSRTNLTVNTPTTCQRLR
ncbi:hypothetical protein KR018_011038, partial [Drosophila ironensis]